jgi:hypothetical protein
MLTDAMCARAPRTGLAATSRSCCPPHARPGSRGRYRRDIFSQLLAPELLKFCAPERMLVAVLVSVLNPQGSRRTRKCTESPALLLY